MKISLVLICIVGFTSTITGTYISSKDTRCRSHCTTSSHCLPGFECQRVQRDGCRIVQQCVRSFKPQKQLLDKGSFVDEILPAKLQGDESIRRRELSQRFIKSVLKSVPQHVIKPQNVVLPELSDKITGHNNKLSLEKVIDARVGVHEAIVPDSKLMSVGRQLELQQCIQRCFVISGCTHETSRCNSQCESVCLQKTVGTKPVVDPSVTKILGNRLIDPADKKYLPTQTVPGKSILNDVNVIKPDSLETKLIGEPALLIDEQGKTHLVDASTPEFKNIENKQIILKPQTTSDILLPVNGRDCFKECNRDGHCGEHGICKTYGCKRVCEYPYGTPLEDAGY